MEEATLDPVGGDEAITSGDWISGTLSSNGEWLVLNVWIDTEPDTDLIEVVEVSTGNVVTQVDGLLQHDLRVGDDGSVYTVLGTGSLQGWVGRLAPGQSQFEKVFDAFAGDFSPWTPMTLLDPGHAGWLGTLDSDGGQTALVFGDLSDGSAEIFDLPAVVMGSVDEQELGDWIVPEMMQPATIWDIERHRALVVHADEERVTVVDLESGDISEHNWSARASFLGGLLAWLVPPAQAKGPSFGTTRDAVLSPSGELLYVATQRADVVTDAHGVQSVESIPLGVDVIDTEVWRVVSRLDIPAAQVSLSPDGSHLITTGMTVTDTISASTYTPHDAYIIETETVEVVGQIERHDDWYPDVQFSAGSRYLYIGRLGGGPITVVDLATAEVLDLVAGPEQQTLFGEAGMLATSIRK